MNKIHPPLHSLLIVLSVIFSGTAYGDQTIGVDVNYYGGNCRICDNQTYACSNGHGAWNNGQRTFTDPVGSANYVTQVEFHANGVFGCSGPTSTIEARLNTWLFDTKAASGQCACGSCDSTIGFVSPTYNAGIPGYVYDGNNTVFMRVASGLTCIARVRVVLHFVPRPSICFRDNDGDGYGDPNMSSLRTACDSGWVTNRADCDDSRSNVKPGQAEVCGDNIDNDCNTQIDENKLTFFLDNDGDTFGTTPALLCAVTGNYRATRNGDCNDGAALVYPGRTEVCNGIDDNCDSQVDEGVLRTFYFDRDADGFGTTASLLACNPTGSYSSSRNSDCDDTQNDTYPGAFEVCDNRDNDCDDSTDELINRSCSTKCGNGFEVCQAGNWINCSARRPIVEVCDGADNDCDGTTDESLTQVCPSPCGSGVRTCNFGQWTACDAEQPQAEVCDGLDNDCDGAIDDGASCGCRAAPTPSAIRGTLEWAWTGSLLIPAARGVSMTPIVANLTDDNGDGRINQQDLPEVLVATLDGGARSGGFLRAISGVNGNSRWTYTGRRVAGGSSPAVGDLDGDRIPEILAYAWRDASRGAPQDIGLIALDNLGRVKWTNADVNRNGQGESGSPAIADIDPTSPGAEIATCFWLISATGQTLWDVMPVGYNYRGACSPAVADLDGDGDMEIAIGARAFHHDGTLAWNNAILQAAWNGRLDAAPAVADLDGDGRPEVVVVRQSVDILDGATGQLKASAAIPGGGNGGAASLADLNGDGRPEIVVAGSSALSALTLTAPSGVPVLSTLWSSTIQDFSSGTTSASIFDLNGDGNPEVVHNDENRLRIFNGRTGAVLWQEVNWSGTEVEFPVIADIDNDNHAEIIVGRNIIDNHHNDPGTYDGSALEGLRVYGDLFNQWIGARTIFNQYSYHVTNVTNAALIPSPETPHWTHPETNAFRNNIFNPTTLNVAPDLTVTLLGSPVQGPRAGSYPNTQIPYCPAYTRYLARVCNNGDAPVAPGLEVGLFLGSSPNGALVAVTQTAQRLDTTSPGNCTNVMLEWNSDRSGNNALYVAVDPDNLVSECVETNNNTNGGALTLAAQAAEVCDGVDNDCNARLDDDPQGNTLTRACQGACGSGQETCDNGAWQSCTARLPSPEACDGRDNDCDGIVDEVRDACGDAHDRCECEGNVCACVAVQTVPSDCFYGCPLGTLCSAGGHCVPFCQDDNQCPLGQRCSGDEVCVQDDDIALGHFTDDGLDGAPTETIMGACSTSPARRAPWAPLSLLVLFGLLLARRRSP